MRISSTFAAATAAFALTGCGDKTPSAETEVAAAEEEAALAPIPCESEGITASDAWIREAQPGQAVTAAYLNLCNGGPADRLLSVAYEGAAAIEVHSTSMGQNGAMVMTPEATGIVLPTAELVEFKPGGAHIMLMGITYAIREGESLPMKLEFAEAPSMTVYFKIKNAAFDGEDEGAAMGENGDDEL